MTRLSSLTDGGKSSCPAWIATTTKRARSAQTRNQFQSFADIRQANALQSPLFNGKTASALRGMLWNAGAACKIGRSDTRTVYATRKTPE